MFVGRDTELTHLEQLYKSDQFQLAIIYGRRRVGKTTLIQEFIKDKVAIYYMGLESNAAENLAALSEYILTPENDFIKVDTPRSPVFPDYSSAFSYVFSLAQNNRIVFVIDEYPYLAGAYRGISSLLQRLIDTHSHESKLMLILCGSSLSFMEYQVLGYQSPLYGRRTAQFKVSPLSFFQARQYFSRVSPNEQLTLSPDSGDATHEYSRMTPQEQLTLYSISGGIPHYLNTLTAKPTLRESIISTFLTPNGYLFEEAQNLLKQECREPAQYNAIVRSIATGSTRLSEIASKVGIDTGLCLKYITALMTLDIIKRDVPFGEERSRRSIYRVADGMFRFWYRYVPQNMTLIQRGESSVVYQRLERDLPAYLGSAFEEVCMEWLWQESIAGRLPVRIYDMGRWWGNDRKRRTEVEIDIVAFTDDGTALFAECKWTNDRADKAVLESLLSRSELFPQKQKMYYLFSKSGFTQGCEELAAECGDVNLVSFARMMQDI